MIELFNLRKYENISPLKLSSGVTVNILFKIDTCALSQIASKASTHIKTSKSIINNRTICDIVNLNKEKTVEELATMISGKVITKGSVEYAKGIIKN